MRILREFGIIVVFLFCAQLFGCEPFLLPGRLIDPLSTFKKAGFTATKPRPPCKAFFQAPQRNRSVSLSLSGQQIVKSQSASGLDFAIRGSVWQGRIEFLYFLTSTQSIGIIPLRYSTTRNTVFFPALEVAVEIYPGPQLRLSVLLCVAPIRI